VGAAEVPVAGPSTPAAAAGEAQRGRQRGVHGGPAPQDALRVAGGPHGAPFGTSWCRCPTSAVGLHLNGLWWHPPWEYIHTYIHTYTCKGLSISTTGRPGRDWVVEEAAKNRAPGGPEPPTDTGKLPEEANTALGNSWSWCMKFICLAAFVCGGSACISLL
jgi:hypothetical protein